MSRETISPIVGQQAVQIPLGPVRLEGDLAWPEGASGLIVFAHGSGSGRHSPRNRFVAQELQAVGLGTLLLDLLTPEEEKLEEFTRHLRFDIDLLASRVVGVIDWAVERPEVRPFPIGLFGASTGAAAALVAAARRPERVAAVVSRGGRPDLAGDLLPFVKAPTLLIVGGDDLEVLHLNRAAAEHLRCDKQIEIVYGATHLFEEPGALEEVASLAADWFQKKLA